MSGASLLACSFLRVTGVMFEVRTAGKVLLAHVTGGSTWCVQVLRSLKEACAAAMQSWRERCEKCVCLQGDYVEK